MTHRNNEEHRIQCGIIEWYDIRYGDNMLFAIPNGGARDSRTGAMLKREGVRAGIWDMFLAKPDLIGPMLFCGLFIEVKVPSRRNRLAGGLTNLQKLFMDKVQTYGYRCEVVYTTQEGIDIISGYLAGNL